jgi:hypothetical protein
VARNYEGVFLEEGCGNLSNIASPLQGEASVALIDATELKTALTSTAMDLNMDENLFKQIKECMSFYFNQCLVRHYPGSCNKVADCLV